VYADEESTGSAPPPATAAASDLPAAITSDAGMEERQADRKQWIANWRADEADEGPPPMTSEAGMEVRQGDRRAWIDAWRARS
jgi:hypothetical protein